MAWQQLSFLSTRAHMDPLETHHACKRLIASPQTILGHPVLSVLSSATSPLHPLYSLCPHQATPQCVGLLMDLLLLLTL